MKTLTLALTLLAATLCSATAGTTRFFTNQDGRTILAAMVSKSETTVTIRRNSDQKEFQIETNTLSQADQEFVRGWTAPQSQPIVVQGPTVTYDTPSFRYGLYTYGGYSWNAGYGNYAGYNNYGSCNHGYRPVCRPAGYGASRVSITRGPVTISGFGRTTRR